MSFRKYGGLDKAATNNIVRNHYSNNDNPTISNLLGQPNSKIVSQSHLDFSGNSVLNLGTLYFIDGTSINTAGPLNPLNPSPAGTYEAPYAITLNNFGNITSIATQDDMSLNGYLTVAGAFPGLWPINVNGDINISGQYLVNGSPLEINNVWLISTINPNNIYYDNGRVGIGGDPSSSNYNLYVNGSAGITTNLFVNGTSTLGVTTTGNATINGVAIINGNATINGTTKITSTLQVDNNTSLGLSGSSTTTTINGKLNINNTSSTTGLTLYYDTNSYIQSLSTLNFTNINNTSTWMTINSTTGFIGIGNPNPSYNLDIIGSTGIRIANANSSALGSIYLGNPTSKYASISTDGTGNMNILNNQTGSINLTTYNLNPSYVTLKPNGIFQIANPPTYPISEVPNMILNVNGDINYEGLLYKNGIAVDFNPIWIIVTDSNNIYYNPVNVGTGNGTVGIGLTNPSSLYKLDVAGIIHTNDNLLVDGVIKNTNSVNPVNINNNLYVNTSKVGIGIIPSTLYTLDVNGIIHTNNDLFVDGSATIGTTTNTTSLSVNGSCTITTNLNVDKNVIVGNVNSTLSNVTIYGSFVTTVNTILGTFNKNYKTIIYGTNSTSTSSGALIVSGGVGISQDTWIGGLTRLTNTINSTSTTTGTLTVSGGVGISQDTWIGGLTRLTNTINSTSTTSGALTVSGGVGISQDTWIGGLTRLTNTLNSVSTTTGALTVSGGVGIVGALNVGGNTSLTGTLNVSAATSLNNILSVSGVTTLSSTLSVSGATTLSSTLSVSGNTTLGNATTITGITSLTNTTNSNSTTGGALRVSGGVGISLDTWIGGLTRLTNTTNSNSTTGGALTVSGGVGISQDTWIGGLTRLTNTLNSTSTTTGALTVSGGVGILGALNVGGNTSLTGTLNVSAATTLSGVLTVNNNTILGNANTNNTTIRGNLTMQDSNNNKGIVFQNGTQYNAYLGGGSSQWLNGTTSGTNTPIYYIAGNVGIGITAPAYSLDVSGIINSNAAIANSYTYNNLPNMNNGTSNINLLDSTSCLNIHNTFIYPANSSNGNGRKIMINMASWGIGNISFNQYANFAIGAVCNTSGAVATNGTSLDINVGCAIPGTPNYTLITAMTIAGQSQGIAHVGIGTASPSVPLDVSGNSRITGITSLTNTTNSTSTITGALVVSGGVGIGLNCTATSFRSTSDYRIKKNVTNLDDTYNIDLLRPVTYVNTELKKQDIGLIAHEVQEIFPDLVNGEKDGEYMQSINYIGLIPVLIKEIQDLKKIIRQLKST